MELIIRFTSNTPITLVFPGYRTFSSIQMDMMYVYGSDDEEAKNEPLNPHNEPNDNFILI